MTFLSPNKLLVGYCAAAVLLLAAFATGASAAGKLLYVKGAGFGHGVGMSQYGAYGYAKHGKDYRFILAHYYSGTSIGSVPASDRTVRVLLAPNRSSLTFTGGSTVDGQELDSTATYKVSRSGNTVKITALGREVASSSDALKVTGSGPLALGGVGKYRGALEFRPGRNGGVNAINVVDVDDYTRGVVANESPASWPAEALKTQAVAARTYAITSKIDGNGFDLYPDTRSQVYKGVSSEDPRSNRAVSDTAGEVVTYNGDPVITYFFSTSGGETESVENSFTGSEPKPWLKAVEDPYDDTSPRHSWTLKFSLAEAEAKLSGLVKGRLRDIKVTKRGDSPRIVKAEVVGSRGRTTVTGSQLLSRLGLYDTWAYFDVVRAGQKPNFGDTSTPSSGNDSSSQPVDSSGGVAANP